MEILSTLFGSVIGEVTDRLISWIFERFEGLGLSGFGPKKALAGIWICQFRFNRVNEEDQSEEVATETMVVKLLQTGNKIKGYSIFAVDHPEVFEGCISNERYFTGTYYNQNNQHGFHGAFQFVLSNRHKRMEGKWIGFNRAGNSVEAENWRWMKVDDSRNVSIGKLKEFIQKVQKEDLFKTNLFI